MAQPRPDPASDSAFPEGLVSDCDGLVLHGGEVTADRILEAYGQGYWPMSADAPVEWHSPDPRLVLFPHGLNATQRLRRTARRYQVRWNERFEVLARMCGDPRRPHGWITDEMIEVWVALHGRGRAHSVEVLQGGQLVGGLYGLQLGGAFFGESMVSKRRDTSKIALLHLCQRMLADGLGFLDCQQVSGHMLRMGAVPLPRPMYLDLLQEFVAQSDRWDARTMQGSIVG